MPEAGKTSSAFWQAVRANHQLQRQSPSLEPAPRAEKIPLSFGQERLWRVDQLQPGATAHNLRAALRLQGSLNLPALEESLQAIVQRHEILRTSFPTADGEPIQQIAPSLTLPLPVVDLTTLTPAQQTAETERLALAAAQQPFDLTQAPLLRLQLLRLADDEHILLRTIHHIITDRWSDSLFISELASLYGAFLRGQPASLPVLPIQYADFAHFQRQSLRGDGLAHHLAFWREQLSGTLAPVQLPVDTAAVAVPRYAGDTQYITLPVALTEALKALAQQAGVSLFVVLLAAFKTLLYQYSGQTDIILCTPVAGRTQVEIKKLIGYFTNLVLLRTAWTDNPSLRELINRVSQVTLGAFQHQDLPLQQIAEGLNIPSPILSRVLFALQNVPSHPHSMADLQLTALDLPEGISNFDLSLSMKMKDGQLVGVLRYKTDLFQATTIRQVLANFQTVLATLVANPDLRLAELPRFATANVAQSAPTEPYVAPATELEQTVATLWQEILHLAPIGVQANYFALGGRSLGMVQIGAEVQKRFNCSLSVAELFQTPTIRGMAQAVNQASERAKLDVRSIQSRIQRQKEAIKNRQMAMQRRGYSHE